MATDTDVLDHSADATGGLDATAAQDVGASAQPGMPQLDVTTYGNQIFWLLVTLVVIYFVLSRIALPRIAAVLAERQGTITNDVAAAEDLKAKSVEAEEAYNKALADARQNAQTIIAEAKADIKADLDEAMAKADAEIAEKAAEGEKKIAEIRASALENVREVARDTAREIVAVMGVDADATTVDQAVEQRTKG